MSAAGAVRLIVSAAMVLAATSGPGWAAGKFTWKSGVTEDGAYAS
jgi:hypothetical protein